MPILKMQGEPILNLLRFRQYFDLCDLIRQRELFRSFAQGHLHLSQSAKYHVSMLNALVTNGQTLGSFSSRLSPEERMKALESVNGESYWENPLKFFHPKGEISLPGPIVESGLVVTRFLYQWCQERIPDTNPRQAIYLLLSAACLLAEIGVPDSMPEPEQLLLAYRQERVTDKGEVELLLPAPTAGKERDLKVQSVTLSEHLYYCAPYCGNLEREERIRTYRLENATTHEIKIRFPTKKEPFTIPANAYRYANAVNGRIIRILPEPVQNGECRIFRSATGLRAEDSGGIREITFPDGIQASSFAVGRSRHEVLAVANYRLLTEWYPDAQALPSLHSRRIVEVSFRNGDYFILQENGKVYSSRYEWDHKRGCVSLAEISEDDGI